MSLEIGDIIKAEVMNVIDSVTVSLRMLPVSGKGAVIQAKSDISLSKGDNILLKVVGGEKEIRLQLVGMSADNKLKVSQAADDIPQAVLKMFAELSGSRVKNSELNLVREMFRSLPESIKAAYPEFKTLEKLMPEIEKLNSNLLKDSVEGSGVLFEARLKLAVKELMQNSKGDALARIFDTDQDQKGMLLKLKGLLKNDSVIEALKSSGFKISDITNTVDKLIKNIEYFQLTSRINDMLYTFLPLSWQELKDGELLFKKNRDDGKRSYTCDINLDLEPAGKLSVSVTLFEGAFYVTFNAEKSDTKSLIISEKSDLEKNFADEGLLLKIINVGHRQEINFGTVKQQGLHIKV
jgi:hypothetical protein